MVFNWEKKSHSVLIIEEGGGWGGGGKTQGLKKNGVPQSTDNIACEQATDNT